MVCNKCKREIDDNVSFCPHCGNRNEKIDVESEKRAILKISKLKILIGVLIVGMIVWGIINARTEKKNNTYSDSSNYTYTTPKQDTMDHSTYCLLYMKVSDVKVTHSSNYAYISGTIKNTGTYQIKYVKVKATAKNSRGNIVDTDWTYAVDSMWLEPGESKNFEMMIKDPSKQITKADVSVVYD